MHPWFAVWVWTLAMGRVWQKSFAPGDEVAPNTRGQGAAPIMVKAVRYLKSEVTEHPLPDFLLDQLAALHWTERDSGLAI